MTPMEHEERGILIHPPTVYHYSQWSNLKPRMKLAPYSTGPLHRQALVCRWEASLNLHCFCLPEVLSREERIHWIWAFLPTSDFSSSFAMACICAPSWVWVLCKQVSPGNSCPTKSIGRRKKPAFFSFSSYLLNPSAQCKINKYINR